MVTRTGPSKSFSTAHSFTLHSGGTATSKEKAREKPRSPLSLSVSGVKSRLGIPEQIQTPPGRSEPPRLQASDTRAGPVVPSRERSRLHSFDLFPLNLSITLMS